MNNVFNTENYIHVKYDLKGSTCVGGVKGNVEYVRENISGVLSESLVQTKHKLSNLDADICAGV